MFEIIDEIRPRKDERSALRTAWLIFCAVCGIGLFLFALKANAAPVYAAEEGGIKIVLPDEACTLPAVSNLQRRATWTEKGKTYEGCWGGHPAFPIVLAYFSDKSVVAFPVQLFVPVTGV